ncbi:hypothetical protein An08g00820 [Aspergillus niger]|uniref:Uncharacterized protein n=2 Tax=Aspergillus niger TaxID=5061 RepID=A2QQ04_ASPNC|nr:hypothetical protein An08g00820 [Aspergillus niger]CAK45234.1 hypothetical protein An08g00820 [Aspergillus niger]
MTIALELGEKQEKRINHKGVSRRQRQQAEQAEKRTHVPPGYLHSVGEKDDVPTVTAPAKLSPCLTSSKNIVRATIPIDFQCFVRLSVGWQGLARASIMKVSKRATTGLYSGRSDPCIWPASQPVAYLFPDSPNLSSLLFSSCKGPGLFSSIMTIRDLLGTEKQH